MIGLPGISGAQMVTVDRIMTEEYGVPVALMMEHAGLNLARLALRVAGDRAGPYRILAGAGNNAGGGRVAARRLASWGLPAEIYLTRGAGVLREVPRSQLARARSMGVPVFDGLPSGMADAGSVTIDAYLGYGFEPIADEATSAVLSHIAAQRDVVCLDVPSGLDSTTGRSYSSIRPRATLTLAFVKLGLMAALEEQVGDLYIADIGVPIDVYADRIGIDWSHPLDVADLRGLAEAFRRDSLHRVRLHRGAQAPNRLWEVAPNGATGLSPAPTRE